MTEAKKPPVTTEILDAVCETLGIYTRVNADKANYHLGWFADPLGKSKESLTRTAQAPILRTLAAILTPIPAPPITDGVRATPKPPCFFAVHDSIPLGIEAREVPPAFKVTVDGTETTHHALGLDLVAFLPKNASLDPNKKPSPKLLARARLARLVTNAEVAKLEQPIEIGVELRLAEKPAPDDKSVAPQLLTALALNVGIDENAMVRVELTDASFVGARTVTWTRGDSLVLPLVHTALLVVRAWVIWLCAKNPPTNTLPPHFAWRLRNHLFPLLEGSKDGGKTVIPSFPLAACAPKPALLKPWLKEFLEPKAILNVLYHLRALLTGKEQFGAAPGSAIAWLSERTGADANAVATAYASPKDRDFGLVVRTTGDVAKGSIAIGLRGQTSWTAGAGVRIGLVLEGDLARADWEGMLAADVTGVSASARTSVQAGRAALFVVIEATAANTHLCTTSLGALVRLEFGAEFSPGSVIKPEVRVTIQGEAHVHSLGQAATDELAALTTAINDLAAAPGMVLPLDIKDAVLAVIDNPSKTAPLLAKLIQWANPSPGTASFDLDLGLATLKLAANADAGTYRATLTPTLAFSDVPLAFTSDTSITVSDTGVSLTTGLELPTIDTLPWQPALVCKVGGPDSPRFALELRKGDNRTVFSLLGGSAPTADLVGKLVRPLLEFATQGFTIDGLGVAEILDILGVKVTADTWAAPDPDTVVKAFLPRLSEAAGALAQSATTSLGLAFDPARLTIAAHNLVLDKGNFAAKIGKLGVTLLNSAGKIDPTLFIDEVELSAHGDDGAPVFDTEIVSVGKLTAKSSLTVIPPKLKSVALAFHDIRLPLGQGGEGSLLSTGKDNPGLSLELGWNGNFYARFPDGSPRLSLAIDRRIGPIDIARLNASLVAKPPSTVPDLDITLDAEFKLGGVRIAPQGLGVVIPLEQLGAPEKWRAKLDGLAIGYREGGVAIAGMLAKNPGGGFIGQATVEAFGFQLGAAAAYGKSATGVTSLAVFGVLKATLGGPPFFVVTGVAAGFGVNRGFDPPKDVADLKSNPLLATMQGNPLTAESFREHAGAYWFAAGVKFVSYGFIKGDALLYVLFDHGFELGLLALASLEIPNLAAINLAIMAGVSTRGEPTLHARAALFDSWLLHKDCKLTGGFALQVWPGLGDAVISLGGYHPAFQRPPNYPKVDRIGFRWALDTAISVKGTCYFAMTPREAMGGGRLEVEGSWGPLAAGFYASVDGLIRWDPFYFDVEIQVGVWTAIDTWFGMLRLSLDVGLHVWGPPVGGVASIDIAVISIDIAFGQQTEPNKQPLPVPRVLAEHLKIDLPPGTVSTARFVAWTGLNLLAAGASAPLRLVVVSGRVGKEPTELCFEPEFVVRIEAAIPLTHLLINPLINKNNSIQTQPVGTAPIYLTLAERGIGSSTLVINTPRGRGDISADSPRERPLALFGDPAAPAGSSPVMTRPLTVAVLWDMSARLVGAYTVDKLKPEYARADEWCPLPLTGVSSNSLANYAIKDHAAGSTWTIAELKAFAPALAARLEASGRPLPRRAPALANVVAVRPAGLYRGKIAYHRRQALAPHAVERPPQILELAYLTLPPAPATAWRRTSVPDEFAAVPRMAPPPIAPRSPLLAGVELHVVVPTTIAAPAPPPTAMPPDLRTRQGKHARSVRAPEGPARRTYLVLDPAAFDHPVAAMVTSVAKTGRPVAGLRTGEVCVLDLARPDTTRTTHWRLLCEGGQHLRVVALDPLGRALADLDLSPGLRDLSLPPGTRRLALFGLGADSPLRAQLEGVARKLVAWRPAEPAPMVAGFSAATTLLGVGPRTFLGPGCVIRVVDGSARSSSPLCLAAAGSLLRSTAQLTLSFAAPLDGVLGVHLQGLSNDGALRELVCTVDDLRAKPQAARVRGDEVVLDFAAPSRTGKLTLDIPQGLRLVGVGRWPGRSERSDRAIHHPVRSHSDETRFALEVTP